MGIGKEQRARITLEALIAKKEQALAAKKKPETAEVYIERMGGTIVLAEPTKEMLRDAVNMEADGDGYLVYQCCIDPILKNKELQEAYGAAVPHEIVDLVFKQGEIAALAHQCMVMAGYADGKVRLVDDLKN